MSLTNLAAVSGRYRPTRILGALNMRQNCSASILAAAIYGKESFGTTMRKSWCSSRMLPDLRASPGSDSRQDHRRDAGGDGDPRWRLLSLDRLCCRRYRCCYDLQGQLNQKYMSWGRNFCQLQLILLWPFFFEVQLMFFEVPAIPIAKGFFWKPCGSQFIPAIVHLLFPYMRCSITNGNPY